MQLFLTLMECVIQDPRCPVEVIQKAGEFTLTYNHSIPSVASLSSLDVALQTSTSLSVSPEDAIPFYTIITISWDICSWFKETFQSHNRIP